MLTRGLRKRRVKCDETQPKCLKCTSNGYVCDGYNSLAQKMPVEFRHLVSNSVWSPIQTADEKASLEFFLNTTVYWFSTAKECRAFFNPLVLQILQLDPIVKHLCIAIGSAHRNIWEAKSVESADAAVMEYHYSSALSCLNRGEEKSLGMILISCLLFCTLESLRGRLGPMIRHLESGINIIHEVQRNPSQLDSAQRDMVKAYISPTLDKLESAMQGLRKHGTQCSVERPDQFLRELQNRDRVSIPRLEVTS